MLVVTTSQMREIDARAIKKYKITGLALMEKAGRALADQAAAMLGDQRSVCLICGKGNNGGDGFAAARMLAEKDFRATVFLLGRIGQVKGEALTQAKKLGKSGSKVREIVSAAGLAFLKKELAGSHLVVDAIFGTGFQGPADKLAGQAIEAINSSGRKVLSADIPSGVDGETGQATGPAVRASVTVTMGLLKTGLLFHPGKELAGRVIVADIGFPEKCLAEQKINVHLAGHQMARNWLPARKPDAHKGSCGTVLVLAGSAGMTGAAGLASNSAMRSGAGLVCLGVPESLNDILEAKLTEVITKPLPETRNRTLSLAALERILKLIDKADSMVIGPGLSGHPETAELVRTAVKSIKIPAVLDADGLNALAARPELLGSAANLVLTPHYGELSRLLKTDISPIKRQPLKYALEAARRFNQTVVLKGAPTVTALPEGRAWINSTGNSGMATAGSGDVLAGLIGGLLAQGLSAERAAVLGVYLHGLAGDLAAADKTEYCLLAGDIIDHFPRAFKKIMEDS
ncbi:MAG: NAD(P)H-hydrate dehydratase [Candidatus Edwardsbacteria bacterium]|nr:NAD(P)H-hydrate dehydratase [Candidatus Edwardsbacteria bacterium]